MAMFQQNDQPCKQRIFIQTLLQNYRLSLNSILEQEEIQIKEREILQTKKARLERYIKYYHQIDETEYSIFTDLSPYSISKSLFYNLYGATPANYDDAENKLKKVSETDVEKLINDIYCFLAKMQVEKERRLKIKLGYLTLCISIVVPPVVITVTKLLLASLGDKMLYFMLTSFYPLTHLSFWLIFFLFMLTFLTVLITFFPILILHKMDRYYKEKYHVELDFPSPSEIEADLKMKVQNQFNANHISTEFDDESKVPALPNCR